MTKRTNRKAWGLVVLLAVVVLGGLGTMLTHGIQFGSYGARLSWSRTQRMGPAVAMIAFSPDGKLLSTIRWYKLGYLRLQVTPPPPRQSASLWRSTTGSRTRR